MGSFLSWIPIDPRPSAGFPSFERFLLEGRDSKTLKRPGFSVSYSLFTDLYPLG
jgi:hypothetical protein